MYRSRTTHAATLLLRGVYREFGGLDPALVGQAHRAAFRFHGRLTPYGALWLPRELETPFKPPPVCEQGLL